MLKILQKMFGYGKYLVEFIGYSWNDNLKIWQERIEVLPWQKVLKISWRFVPRMYEPWRYHDEELGKLLWQRLFRIEQPVSQWDTRLPLLRVDNGSSNDDIKKEAELHLTPFDKPRFVVEDCGKLRGFALSPQLVIAGVTAVSSVPEIVEEQARKLGYSLLTERDAVYVEKHWDVLCQMMAKAGVPSLQDVNFFQLEKDGFLDYPAWHHPRQRVSYIDFDDSSILLAKL